MFFPSALLAALTLSLSASSVFSTATPSPVGISINPPLSVVTSASITRRDLLSINPLLSSVVKDLATRTIKGGIEGAPVTNAQRLARGLPLLPPKHRRSSRRAAAARGHHARAPAASPTPITPIQGYLLITNVTDAANPKVLGYASNVPNFFGEYTWTDDTPDVSSRLIVEIPDSDGGNQLDLTVKNGPYATSFPFFGSITGFASLSSDLSTGSYNYAYIGGTAQTSPNAPPTLGGNSFTSATLIPEKIESAIWSYDPKTQAVTPSYINSDSSKPDTVFGYADSGDAFILTGDATVFTNTFGVISIIKATFVPL